MVSKLYYFHPYLWKIPTLTFSWLQAPTATGLAIDPLDPLDISTMCWATGMESMELTGKVDCTLILMIFWLEGDEYCTILGGGFQYFFIFTSTGGNDPIWPAYFSNGLAQPPASIGKEKTWDPPFNGRFGESSTQQVPIKRGDVSSQEGIWSIIYYHQSTRWWF